MSRTLIYFPIMHTEADLGALRDAVVRTTLEKMGRAGLRRKLAVIDKLWTDITAALDSLNLSYEQVRLYQDGLPVCGREQEIVKELAQTGNRNFQLLRQLMARGATLMGTESGDLLLREHRLTQQSLTTRLPRSAGVAAQRKAESEALLAQRDQYIAARINETLKDGETGILFLGMLHSPQPYLVKDIKVIYPLHRLA